MHPVVTSIVLGGPSSNCTTDPTTACCPLATTGAVTAPPYLANSCISQGSTAQLVARVYAGTGANQTNISCLAGHLQLSAQGASSTTAISPVVSIDQNGVATANQPGSVLISANIADAASSAGFFSTCPPASITLTTPGSTANPVVVNQNNPQALVASAIDTNGVSLTGLNLEYVSTAPTTIPASLGGTVTPPLAGAASISAVCQPPNCNMSSYNQIGLFGNGKPVTSNSVNITAPGTNSTVLYMASTQSQYMVQIDFTTSVLGQPFLLPYVPNSMVISNDGSTIYMGSSTALMVVNAVNTLSITRTDPSSPGTVLAISPNGNILVLSDPVRQIISLESSSGGVLSTYGGVATHAEFAPDSQTVYITAGNQLLVYSANSGWTNIVPATSAGTPVTDVAVTVPAVGAYFAGPTTTARSYCSVSTPTTPTNEANVFYPPADSSPAITDRLAATNDGMHVLGASVTPDANPERSAGQYPCRQHEWRHRQRCLPLDRHDELLRHAHHHPSHSAYGDGHHRGLAHLGLDARLCHLHRLRRRPAGLCSIRQRTGDDHLHQALRLGYGPHRRCRQRGQLHLLRGDLGRQPRPPHHPARSHRGPIHPPWRPI